MVVGNLIGPKIAYYMGIMPSIFITMIWGVFVFAIFSFMVDNAILAVVAILAVIGTFLVGASFVGQPSLQTKIMDVSDNAATLATALMQSSFLI